MPIAFARTHAHIQYDVSRIAERRHAETLHAEHHQRVRIIAGSLPDGEAAFGLSRSARRPITVHARAGNTPRQATGAQRARRRRHRRVTSVGKDGRHRAEAEAAARLARVGQRTAARAPEDTRRRVDRHLARDAVQRAEARRVGRRAQPLGRVDATYPVPGPGPVLGHRLQGSPKTGENVRA